MALPLLIGFLGLVIGACFLTKGGWVIGALLGFLLAKVFQLDQKVNDQMKELSLLQTMQEYLNSRLREVQPIENAASIADEKKSELAGINVAAEVEIKEEPLIIDIDIDALLTKEEIASIDEPNKEPVRAASLETNIESDKKPTHQPQIPPQHRPQSEPQIEDKIIGWVRNFFFNGNPVVRVGMVILFIGLSFLVKYAATGGYFPIELRLSCVGMIAIALIFFGWQTRNKEGGYGLVLQGGGLAALYLTSFAAAKMYEVMPTSIALILLFVFVIFGVILALLQNAQVLAIMATAGGFLAPILTSDGSGNHVGLFSVYLILNLGVFAISWFKSWRLLNWIGFVFTFVITAVWGVLKYEPQFYASTQPFLIAFFLLYLIISVLFSLKQPPNLKGLVDGSLVFGLPVAAFSLQVALLKHTEYGLAISALILAFIYIGLTRWLWMKYLHTHKLLAESFLALGVGFATLAIPLGLNADWTSATWAFEAAGLLWIGLRQQRLLPRCAGVVLYFAACIATLKSGIDSGITPIITGDFIGLLILSFAGFLMAYHYYRFSSGINPFEKFIGNFILLVAMIWAVTAVIMETNNHFEIRYYRLLSWYFIFAAGLLLQISVAKKCKWPDLGYFSYFYFIIIVILTLFGFVDRVIDYPTSWLLGLPFIVFLFAQYRYLWQMESLEWKEGLNFAHMATSLLLLLILLWQASGLANDGIFSSVLQTETSRLFCWFIVFVPVVIGCIVLNTHTHWPMNNWKRIYQDLIPIPFILIVFGWFLIACKEAGSIFEFYLPVLNPLDLAQLAVIILSGFVLLHGLASTHYWSKIHKASLIGSMIFFWVNIVTLRAIHQYTHIEYDFVTLWQNSTVQMSLSILWSSCALVVMNLARKNQHRSLWIVGGGLLLLVILKLFTKDLSSSSGITRIVSFMAVGGLMLLIGYISPMPPAAKNNQESLK